MSITVTAASPNRALTSIEEVKQTIGETSFDYDDVIESMILSATDFAERYCGRKFALQTVQEAVPGDGRPELLLSITPIVEIDSLTYNGTVVTDYSIHDAEAGILFREQGFTSTIIPRNTLDAAPSSYAKKTWVATYTGGYVPTNGSYGASAYGARTLPYDLERAIIDMVKMYFLNRNVDPSMSRYKIGETQIYWDRSKGEGSLPPQSKKVLDYYRRAF